MLTMKGTYSKAIRHVLILLVGLAMLYPVLWLLSSSFKPNQAIFTDTGLWSHSFTFDNYKNGWKGFQGVSFSRFFGNSALISILCVLGNIVTCSLAAYAFARLDFKLKKYGLH